MGGIDRSRPTMTDSPSPAALRGAAPKRQRGHDRVAAILQASTVLFLDKGYDAVTMTEIASASQTAIGSLYRFFPSKEAVADALLRQYTESLGEGLARLHARVGARDRALGADGLADGLADALVDFMSGLHAERGVALALVDARGLEDSRHALRDAMLDALQALLGALLPGVSNARLATMALAVLHVLKGVAQMPDGSAPAPALLDEYRRMLRAYVESSLAQAPA
jgi:AcrR family transcriptional regulator